jgi:hypothetical protein
MYIIGVMGSSQLALIFVVLLLIILPLVIYILFNISMQTAMNKVSQKNRRMEGGLIWLNLIPLLNIVWPFVFNNALRESYKKEFDELGIKERVNLISGMIYPGLRILSAVLWFIFSFSIALSLQSSLYNRGSYEDAIAISSFFSVFMSLIGLTSLVLWIVFWVNVNGLKRILESRNGNVNSNQIIDRSPVNTNQFQTTDIPLYQESSNAPVKEIEKPAEVVVPPTVNKQVSSIEKLKKYHDMLSEGLITQDDFDRVKKELLNQK